MNVMQAEPTKWMDDRRWHPTQYRFQQGLRVAYADKRDDGRWWVTFQGTEKRIGKKCTTTSVHRALLTLGW